MPLTCLSCRSVVADQGPAQAGSCPHCGGALAGERGAWIEWSGACGSGSMLLPSGCFSIGRRDDNALVLEDREVSKVHARIHPEGDDWYLRDVSSSNGTFANGQRVAERKLSEGDELLVGRTRIVFHARGTPAGSVTIASRDADEPIQACLEVLPGDFKAAAEIGSEEELRADHERLRLAYLFNRYMGHERDEKALLSNILKLAFDLVPADRAAILLREEPHAPLSPALARHRDASLGPTEEIVIPDSILRRAIEERSAVLSGDATADLRFQGSQSVLSQSVRSAMCVPLVGEREVLGAIHLDTREQTGAFSVKELQLLTVLASQAAMVLERARLHRRLDCEAQTRERLARFLAPQVLQEVVERGLDLQTEGRTGRVSVLFCDIRGFTSLAETMESTQLLRMLNAYFERMVDVVFGNGGVLDKFIGDALMAVWGAPIERSDDAYRAVSAGAEMLHAVEGFNLASRSQGWPPLEIGVGVNTGEAVIGAVGSSRRMEYTVMGDAVNLASRLCELARGGQLLITERTRQVACLVEPAGVRALPSASIRGRKQKVSIFEVVTG
ncbi:MAG: FHA domain-containing protein [Deltaproteobacteria bacterium]|nr:FHA domain-containing protein [Deltaproteobacteria bacterium]